MAIDAGRKRFSRRSTRASASSYAIRGRGGNCRLIGCKFSAHDRGRRLNNVRVDRTVRSLRPSLMLPDAGQSNQVSFPDMMILGVSSQTGIRNEHPTCCLATAQ